MNNNTHEYFDRIDALCIAVCFIFGFVVSHCFGTIVAVILAAPFIIPINLFIYWAFGKLHVLKG